MRIARTVLTLLSMTVLAHAKSTVFLETDDGIGETNAMVSVATKVDVQRDSEDNPVLDAQGAQIPGVMVRAFSTNNELGVKQVVLNAGSTRLALCSDPTAPGVCDYFWPKSAQPLAANSVTVVVTFGNNTTSSTAVIVKRPP